MTGISNNIKPIVIEQYYKHSIHKVFKAFSQKNAFEQWIAPSDEIGTKILLYDFTVGGQYRIEFSIPGAGIVYLGGEYVNIESPTQICFTWVWEEPDIHADINSLVTVKLLEHEGHTKLVITHDNLSTLPSSQRHLKGWTGTLARLGNLLTSNSMRD